jgi:predicted outer membrane protein
MDRATHRLPSSFLVDEQRPIVSALRVRVGAIVPPDAAGASRGGTMLGKVVVLAGLAGWTTSAVFIAVTEPHFFTTEEQAFITTAALTSNYELKAAQLAQRLAASDSARADAARVVLEQTRFADALNSAARHGHSFTWPTGIDGPHQRLLARLRSPNADFAAEYDRQMISSHLLTQVANQEYLDRQRMDGRVRKVITQSLPTVESRLRSAVALAERRLASIQ